MTTTTLCSMTCRFCGYEGELDDFCRTPVSGDLPRGTYQCPKCRRAIRRVTGKPTVHRSGFVMTGEVKLVEVEGVL